MTTEATQIRDAIFTRLSRLAGYKKFRKTPVPQLQRNQLPALSVYTPTEDWSPPEEIAFQGEPRFINHATISISVMRGFDDPVVLEGLIDADMDAIENTLLTDATFIGGEDQLIEGIVRIQRRRAYPLDGEAYFAELRLDITFQFQTFWPPVVPDAFTSVKVSIEPNGDAAATVTSDHQPATEIFQIPQ